MKTYTPKQYAQRLKAKLKEVDDAKIIFLPASTIHADKAERIFDKGENCNNSEHGKYSTSPIYVNTTFKSPKKLQPKGKSGKTNFKTSSRKRKTTYFQGGYKQFKGAIGRGTKVNFRLTNDLQTDYISALKRRRDKWVNILKRVVNEKKYEGLTDRFGNCSFDFSQKERKEYRRLVSKQMKKQFWNAI